MPKKDQLEAAVKAACERLIELDRPLFERDVNERSLSHKFAMHLQMEVEKWKEGWNVDCEFNRDARDTGEDYAKQLELIDKLDSLTTDVHDQHATTVFPDVIVHRRGENRNLLVIEMKKHTASAKDVAFDKIHKLQAYVNQFGYEAAAFIMMNLKTVRCNVEWIKTLD